MNIKPTHRSFVKALALGDEQEADTANAAIPDSERDDLHLFITAFFSIMLECRFGETVSRDAIAEFVNEMRYDYRNAKTAINPLAIEGVIRGTLGEEHLFDGISPEDTLRAELLVIGKVASQASDVIPRIDDYLNEAAGLVAAWEAEDA